MKNAIWLFVFAIATFLVFLPAYRTLQEKKLKNKEYETEIYALVEKNSELKKERQRLEEDPVYLEKIAREKLGIVREGETVFKVTPVNKEEAE